MSERSVNFHRRPDGIIIFEFSALHRAAADEFVKIVRAGMNNVPDKLRIIYNFSTTPAPTGYFLHTQGKLYEEYPHPADEKVAYVIGKHLSTVWVNILRKYFNGKEIYQTFHSEDEAIKWLLED